MEDGGREGEEEEIKWRREWLGESGGWMGEGEKRRSGRWSLTDGPGGKQPKASIPLVM